MKLDKMISGLDDFQAVMREGTRAKKETDAHKLAELRAEIEVLERTVTATSEKRAEVAKSISAWAQSQARVN